MEAKKMNLKELRTQLNLTQAALAKELGVTSKTISLIESGKMKLSDKLAAKIKEVYGEEINATVVETKTPVVEKTVEKKAEKKARATKKVEVEAEKKAEPAVETVAIKAAAPVKAAKVKKAPVKKKALAPKKTQTAPKAPVVILQSPFGGEITAEEILSKVGLVDTVYVRIDQNKAYWVKGEENGEVDLW